MRFPLFLSTKPSIGLRSMRVLLGKGDWTVESEELDSKLQFFSNGLPVSLPLSLASPSSIEALVTQAGSSTMNVYLCLIDSR